MSYRLPPLSALRLFESAGRHLSFKAAAEELHLTPSAVSHGIKGLEDWLGVPLFVREHRSLSLSEAGADYLPKVREALDCLVMATEALPGRGGSGKLSVSVAPTFGQCWLIPKLAAFSRYHPDIEVSLDTNRRHVDFPRDGVDLAIRMGPGGWPDVDAVCLVQERLVPVATPEVAREIAGPEDLARHTLLHVTSVSEDWAVWADLADLDRQAFAQGPRFDTLDMAFEAAAEGVGVAIGRLPLIAADVAAGRLATLLGPPRPCRTGYWLTARPDVRTRPAVALFREWIESEIAEERDPDKAGS